MRIQRNRNSALPARLGAAAVEFAIAAPILFLLLFGAIEFSRANMLVNTAAIAATEAARASIIPGATADECRAACMQELSVIGVNTAIIAVEPAEITDDTTQVTINLSVPVTKNGYVLSRFFLGKNVRKSVTLQREGKTEAVENEPKEKEKKEKKESDDDDDDDDDDD